jgi:hypothetical protein
MPPVRDNADQSFVRCKLDVLKNVLVLRLPNNEKRSRVQVRCERRANPNNVGSSAACMRARGAHRRICAMLGAIRAMRAPFWYSAPEELHAFQYGGFCQGKIQYRTPS